MPTRFNVRYVLFDNVFWTAMSGQVNRWRKKTLNIKRTSLETLAQTKVCYNLHPEVSFEMLTAPTRPDPLHL